MATSKRHLLSLPPETLDEILTNVPSSTSLLSLSMSSKVLATLILPHHLPLRVIRTPLSRTDLWEYLTRDELHAANVRSLTILPDDYNIYSPDEYAVTEKLPPIPEDTQGSGAVAGSPAVSKEESEAMLVSALRRMVRLQHFAWYHISPPVLRGEDDVWSALRRLGTVRELDIRDVNLTDDKPNPGIIFSDTFLSLNGFTAFKLRSSALDDLQDEPDLAPLINMLQHNCPNLESLSLSLQLFRHMSTASLSSLLSHVSWPHLGSVRLTTGLGCSAASLARFLRAHPGIEELALGRMLPGRSWSEFGQALYHGEDGVEILPRLRSLECSAAQSAAILTCPKKTLERLTGVEVHDIVTMAEYFDWDDEWEEEHADEPEEDTTAYIPSPWKSQFLERLAACPSVMHLGLRHTREVKLLEVLAKIAPQLTAMYVETDIDFPVNLADLCAIYALFPYLHTITAKGYVYLGPLHLQPNIESNNASIQMLASACPQLRVLDNGAWKAILIRDADEDKGGGSGSVRWVVRERNASEEGKIEEGEVVYGS